MAAICSTLLAIARISLCIMTSMMGAASKMGSLLNHIWSTAGVVLRAVASIAEIETASHASEASARPEWKPVTESTGCSVLAAYKFALNSSTMLAWMAVLGMGLTRLTSLSLRSRYES